MKAFIKYRVQGTVLGLGYIELKKKQKLDKSSDFRELTFQLEETVNKPNK